MMQWKDRHKNCEEKDRWLDRWCRSNPNVIASHAVDIKSLLARIIRKISCTTNGGRVHIMLFERCVCVQICVHMHTRVHTSTPAHAHMNTPPHPHKRVHIPTHACTSTPRHTQVNAPPHQHTHTCTQTHTPGNTHTRTHPHRRTHTHACTYTHTHALNHRTDCFHWLYLYPQWQCEGQVNFTFCQFQVCVRRECFRFQRISLQIRTCAWCCTVHFLWLVRN